MTIGVFDILSRVYGAKGIPFPRPPKQGNGTAIAPVGSYDSAPIEDVAIKGSLIRKFDDSHLGTYQFLPASINGTDIPNAVVIINGEKEIEETTIVDVGTVFEKVFTRPYDITIIATLIGNEGNWPQRYLQTIKDLWQIDEPLTLRCALTDIFLNKNVNGQWVDNPKNNFVIKRISILDNRGSENVEVVQIDGMSNIEFELELI